LPARAAADSAPTELRHDTGVDTAVTLGLFAATTTAVLARELIAPHECRWCATNPMDLAVRERLVWSEPETAATISDVGLLGVVPIVSLGSQAIAAAADGRSNEIGVNLLLTLEAVAMTAFVTEVVKLAVARERPAARMSHLALVSPPSIDSHLSFLSGHTSVSAAFATASGTIASMRGYGSAPWVFVAGGVPAAATGYLRIAADRHWFSDVLMGAGLGIAIGALVPLWLHPSLPAAPASAPSSGATPSVVVPLAAGLW
jgi:membrane-associated phospholipid phosphatase